MMRRPAPRRLAALAVWSLFLAAAAPGLANARTDPAPSAPAADAARRLADHLVASDDLATDLGWLCDRIGGRITGSSACRRAVVWAVDRFKQAGVDAVGTETFEVPSLWLPGTARFEVLEPEAFLVPAVAVPFAPSTGRPVSAPIFDAGGGSPEDFERAGDAARGAIGLVRTRSMETLVDLFMEYMRDRAMIEAAHRAGAAGLVLMSTRPRGLLYRHPVLTDGTIAPIPVVLAAREPALRLGRILDTGEPVRGRIAAHAEVGGPYESENVVAEIRGREKPEEIVLIGAHLDSWDLGTGAEDNGVNCAAVIAIARAVKALALTPRRTVRFVLFTGEEQGMWGSTGYVKRHAAELDAHVAVIIMDIGSGAVRGFYLNGREELRAAVEAGLDPVAHLGPFQHEIEAIDGTDNFDFLLSGVPNLVADQDATAYLPEYHATSDVLDMVNLDQASRNAAIFAALAWSIAENPERPAARQSRAEVEALIGSAGLEPQMRAFGQWDAWKAGERGAHP